MGALRRLLGLEPGPLSAAKAVADGSGVMPVGWHVDEGKYIDVAVPAPTGGYTTAWSSGVTLVDPGVPLSSSGETVNVEHIWKTQPNVRKVVDFVARNVASIPLHLYERASDTDRRRVTDHPLADLLRQPQPRTTPLRFWKAVIADGLLYDRWAALKVPTVDGGSRLMRIPARRFQFELDSLDQVTGLKVYVGGTRDAWRSLSLDEVVFDFGYSPSGAGLTPMQTLADVLAESAEAVRFRRQVWKNGARIPMWIEVPQEAVDQGFDDERFDAEFKARFTGDGPDAGGAPTMKDGIKLHKLEAFSAQDMQDIEGRRLTAIEVAAAFHIAPELVGARQGNYSNVREYRSMLYRDSLGPYIAAWEQAVNAMLLPDFTDDRPLYVEANIEAKLRGSFEDQAQYLQAAVGRPYMTADEARSKLNMPALGGDAAQLVTPMNVLVGGQASPQDSGSQNLGPKARPVWRVKASDTIAERLRTGYAGEVAEFVERQKASVLSALGAKSSIPVADVWDTDRWDRELAAITIKRMRLAATMRAAEVVDALEVEDFDEDVMLPWLVEAGKNAAHNWNAKTLDELTSAARASDWQESLGHVFTLAAAGRALYLAHTTTTDAGNFGAAEVARRGGLTLKTWTVTSGNSRSSHAAMNGETVPVGETFSNGARWPGDAVLPEEERANCQCEITFSREDT